MRLLIPTLCALLGLSAAPVSANQNLRFQVFLDERPIGEHSFRITERNGQTEVSSRASFDVDFLFLTAYRYRHSSDEVFRDGCLTEISADTNDNGKRLAVAGTPAGADLRITRPSGALTATGCVKTFAYWDPAFLDHDRLLNPQTGEFEPVTVRQTGAEQISVGGREVAATRYALSTTELTIDLWYNDELGWVGLESDTGKGKRLIYRRQ